MLVEFFGLPGAGKSTISREVAELLLGKGLIVDEVTYRLDHVHRRAMRAVLKCARCASFTCRNPREAALWWARIAATRQATVTDLGKAALNWSCLASLAAGKRFDGTITFLDQGVAQALWSIGFAAGRDSWLDVMLGGAEAAPIAPDLVIHVHASFPTIRDRLSRREPHVSRLERDLGANDAPLRRAEALAAAVARQLHDRGVPLIEVANDRPEQLAVSARRVAAVITCLLQQRRGMLPGRSRNEPRSLPWADGAAAVGADAGSCRALPERRRRAARARPRSRP